MATTRRSAAQARRAALDRCLPVARADRTAILLEMYERAPHLNERQLYDFALDTAVRLTDSEVGFFHRVASDQQTIVLTTWNAAALTQCSATGETHYPLADAGNWVDCVRERRPVVYNDYPTAPNRKGLPPGHAPVRRFASVPVMDGERVCMIFGVGNKAEPYDDEDVRSLQRVADQLQQIVSQRSAQDEVRRLNAELERRVAERTAQLEQANKLLREREVELWDKEVRWRTLFEMASDAIFLIAEDVVIQCNERALELFGVGDRDEMLERPLWAFFPLHQPDGRDSMTACLEIWEALDDATPRCFEWTCRRSDGTLIETEVTARRLFISRKPYVQAIVRDVTARHQAEQMIRKLGLAIDQCSVGVVITDVDGVIEYVNPEFTRMTGYEVEEALGRTPRILKSGRQSLQFYEELWETVKLGHTWHGEFCNRRKDGTLYWESSSIAPLRDPRGRLTHFVAIKQDISQARQVADELSKAKTAAEVADRLKTAFLANMSHELRTPLNAILGFSQLIQQDGTLRHDHQQSLDIVISSGGRLLKLIDEIIDMSKLEANCLMLRPSLFDLPLLLEEIRLRVAAHAEAKGLRLEVACAADVPRYVSADEARIRQVIVHMLSNALKFTRSGEVTMVLGVARSPAPSPLIPLVLEVTDTGCGIAADELERVFVPFDQTASGRQSGGGTGLSMPFSRELARLMGGDLVVTSVVGRGTSFVFTFLAERLAPLDEPPAQPITVRTAEAGRETRLREAAAGLPHALRQRLYHAVERADVDVFGTLLHEAALPDRTFIEALDGLASGYQYETLLRVLAP